MTTTAHHTARERQLDWLLGEALGGTDGLVPRRTAERSPEARWLTAAVVLLGLGALGGVFALRKDAARSTPAPATSQDTQPIEWTECFGAAGLAAVPVGTTNLRCYDFDDDAIAKLAENPRFAALQRLDLGAMDVSAQGYSVSLKISDDGVAHLAKLTALRWLSLQQCHEVKGTTFAALEAMPQLEHLDLTYSGVTSPGVERLANLLRLRSLSLSACMGFHGRSLAALGKLGGLQRLELRACVTLSAADLMVLPKLRQLRYLDLRDCQGRFRGQTESFGAPAEAPPTQDGIGLTDAVVAALVELPLETLLLGGSDSLTDAIGPALAKLTRLRELDLARMLYVTGSLLPALPASLEALSLDYNWRIDPATLARLPALPDLRELGLINVQAAHTVIAGRRLTSLRIGREQVYGGIDVMLVKPGDDAYVDAAQLAEALRSQPQLTTLVLANREGQYAGALRAAGSLPNLRELTVMQGAAALPTPAQAPQLRVLRLLYWGAGSRPGSPSPRVAEALAAARDLKLTELSLVGSQIEADEARRLASAWPGCQVRLPQGQRYRVP